jgi:hypothetical protein
MTSRVRLKQINLTANKRQTVHAAENEQANETNKILSMIQCLK